MSEQTEQTPIEELEALIAENLQVTPSFYNNPSVAQPVQSYAPIQAFYVPQEYGIYSSTGYFSSQNLYTNYATASYINVPQSYSTGFAFTALPATSFGTR